MLARSRHARTAVRALATGAAKAEPGFFAGIMRDEVKRSRVVIGSLALANVLISLELVKRSHKAQDREEAMREELRSVDRARRLLLQCGPELARQAGLPPRAMGGFDAAMRAVAEEAASAEAAEALAPMRAAEEPGGEKKTAIAIM